MSLRWKRGNKFSLFIPCRSKPFRVHTFFGLTAKFRLDETLANMKVPKQMEERRPDKLINAASDLACDLRLGQRYVSVARSECVLSANTPG